MSDLESMDKQELIKLLKEQTEKSEVKKDKVRKYVKKYQQTEKGAVKSREANHKYYKNNRAVILEKKRLYYQKLKAQKQETK